MTRPFASKMAILVGAVVTAFILTLYRPSPHGLDQETAPSSGTAALRPGRS